MSDNNPSRVGKAWCSPHNMHPNNCFDLHHQKKKLVIPYTITYEIIDTDKETRKRIAELDAADMAKIWSGKGY